MALFLDCTFLVVYPPFAHAHVHVYCILCVIMTFALTGRRPILSFDVDLMDCTVLASVISSYAPYMVRAHVTITI